MNRIVAYDENQILQVLHQPVVGRKDPFEFATHRAAVTVLPIIDGPDDPKVLSIVNTRTFYGESFGLPGGMREGRFDNHEDPIKAALRELLEETGYGYPEGDGQVLADRRVEALGLRAVCNTINYPRHLVVARGVSYIGGERSSGYESIVISPTPVDDFLEPLFNLEGDHLNPEINLAFAKAAKKLGPDAVRKWLVEGGTDTEDVPRNFKPWLYLS